MRNTDLEPTLRTILVPRRPYRHHPRLDIRLLLCVLSVPIGVRARTKSRIGCCGAEEGSRLRGIGEQSAWLGLRLACGRLLAEPAKQATLLLLRLMWLWVLIHVSEKTTAKALLLLLVLLLLVILLAEKATPSSIAEQR